MLTLEWLQNKQYTVSKLENMPSDNWQEAIKFVDSKYIRVWFYLENPDNIFIFDGMLYSEIQMPLTNLINKEQFEIFDKFVFG